jgi:hypothetical protein
VARQNAEPDLQPMCAKCVAADLFELPCKVCGKPVEVSRKYAAHGLFDNGVGCDECSSPSGNQGSER